MFRISTWLFYSVNLYRTILWADITEIAVIKEGLQEKWLIWHLFTIFGLPSHSKLRPVVCEKMALVTFSPWPISKLELKLDTSLQSKRHSNPAIAKWCWTLEAIGWGFLAAPDYPQQSLDCQVLSSVMSSMVLWKAKDCATEPFTILQLSSLIRGNNENKQTNSWCVECRCIFSGMCELLHWKQLLLRQF